MNAWHDLGSPHPDLAALVARAHALGAEAVATPLAAATVAALLGIEAPRVAMMALCGASTETAVHATREDDDWVLRGTVGAVPWGESAATLLVTARTEPFSSHSPVGLFVVDAGRAGVSRTPRSSIGTPSASHVRFDGVRVDATDRFDEGHSWESINDVLDRATIVVASELAGVARGALDAAIAYATVREQFGAPIATYQALAHRLADMAVDTDSAELAVEEAVDAPTPENVSRAKIIANEAAQRVTAGLHQINGGVGFYADQAPPAYFARALALRVELGDSRAHRLRLAGRLAYPA
jgi:alkylation response protein AidB-like acyl-CoA dehydrogenase